MKPVKCDLKEMAFSDHVKSIITSFVTLSEIYKAAVCIQTRQKQTRQEQEGGEKARKYGRSSLSLSIHKSHKQKRQWPKITLQSTTEHITCSINLEVYTVKYT